MRMISTCLLSLTEKMKGTARRMVSIPWYASDCLGSLISTVPKVVRWQARQIKHSCLYQTAGVLCASGERRRGPRVRSKILAMRQHICERVRADWYCIHECASLHLSIHAYIQVVGSCVLEGVVGRLVGRRFRITVWVMVAVGGERDAGCVGGSSVCIIVARVELISCVLQVSRWFCNTFCIHENVLAPAWDACCRSLETLAITLVL